MLLQWLNLRQFQTILLSSVSVVLRPMSKFSFERSLIKFLALSVLGREVSRSAENNQLLDKTSYFRILTEHIFHLELCEGSHQNERSHFVRCFFIESKFFVYWGTYNDCSSSEI